MIYGHIHGVPVYESNHAVKLSGKILRPKDWHRRRGYADRVSKKWAKRYGPPVYEPVMFIMRDPITGAKTFVVHPSLAPQLRLDGR